MQSFRRVPPPVEELRAPLLTPSSYAADVAGTAASDAVTREGGGPSNMAAVRIVHTGFLEYVKVVGLVVSLCCPILMLVYVIIDTWQKNPSNRSWLILGLAFYIGSALKLIYEATIRMFDRLLFLRVEIRRVVAATLFDAVSNVLQQEAERSNETCSRDSEAVQEHDPVTGHFAVRLNFWSTRPRILRVSVSVGGPNGTPVRWLPLVVEYSPGTDIVCGRDSRLQSQAALVLSTRTTRQRVCLDKKLLCQWLEESYETWVRPIEGVVKVYALQQMSSDWTPEWKVERVKSCKSVSGSGLSCYLQRNSLQRILVDAQLWSSHSLRVYMVSGPPGVGKSEFIIWLAGQLGLSIYRVSLSSTSLTDNLLAQLLSQSSIKDNTVLVQFDEFQETLQRWCAAVESTDRLEGVTAGGFCECIQGATAMKSGVMIVTGTTEITAERAKQALPAVYRRIHCTSELTWMAVSDVRSYFLNFFEGFLGGVPHNEWEKWAGEFLCNSPWAGSRSISIDMLNQFFMMQITTAIVEECACKTANSVQVPDDRRVDFFKLICDSQSAESFLNEYAPVESVR